MDSSEEAIVTSQVLVLWDQGKDLWLLAPLFLIVAFQGAVTLEGGTLIYCIVAGGVLAVMMILTVLD